MITAARWALANWKLVLIAALLGLLGLQTVRIAGLQKDAAEQRASLAEATQRAEKAERAEETRRQTAIDKEVNNAQPIFQAEARDAAAAPDSRVREPAIRYIRRACPNPPAASPSAPAGDPLLVFADVLGRIEQRSEDLARIAGERGAAGTLCERYADKLQPAAGP